MWIFAVAMQDGRLSLREIMADIPHDIPAMVVYGLFALFIGFIVWGSRSKSGAEGSNPTTDGSGPARPAPEERHD